MINENYIKYNYADFWRHQSYKYGIGEIEKFILAKILNASPRNAYEVGIGNGYPYAKMLHDNGVEVDGCDLSPVSVASARRLLGMRYDAKNIRVACLKEARVKRRYDCVYCIRSSWYIENLKDLIVDMINITQEKGMIVFDIMDEELLGYKTRIRKKARTFFEKYFRSHERGDENIFHNSYNGPLV